MATREDIKKLGEPTPPAEVKKRAGPGGMQLSYVDARYHYDRLDTVVGATDWQSAFERDTKGNLRAGIGIWVDELEQWVWKWDTGTPSTMEPEKGEHSDALKRAGVQWGISRDLYDSKPEASAGSRPAPAPTPAGAAPSHATSGWSCPVHGTVKVVPPGVSKRTGKPYPAFEVCGDRNCDMKPPRGSKKPSPVFVAPEPDEYVGMGPDDDDEDFAAIAEGTPR